MKKTKVIISLILTLIVILAIGGVCFADGNMTISQETLNLKAGGTTYRLYVSNKPSGTTETWTSSNPSVATVDSEGKVTTAAVGTTTITATAGDQTATCEVTVVYDSLKIKAQTSDGTAFLGQNGVNLVLSKYPTKQLVAIVKGYNLDEIPNVNVTWTSSKTSVATVDSTGKITAVATGTTTITATADTVSDSVVINVLPAPEFTDFSNAKFELLFDILTDLKISGITPKENSRYNFIITTSKTEPTLVVENNGSLNGTETGITYLTKNDEENYLYHVGLDKYVELNSDMYLWVTEEVDIEGGYQDDEDRYVNHDVKFVVKGEKLTKPELPKLNSILRSFWLSSSSYEGGSEYTYFRFRIPSNTENRKFTLKIGKVTDNTVLNKIHNGDYSGITSLLTIAKNDSSPIYNKDLTTTRVTMYNSDDALFDGRQVLSNKAFYYIYTVFDDENGKYAPVEGVTLAQAWLSESESKAWDLWSFDSDKIEWNNLSSTPTDDGKAPGVIPQTGESFVIVAVIGLVAVAGVTGFMLYRKNNF